MRGGARVACLSAALAALLMLAFGASEAAAAGCGQTITTDTTLTGDLTNCAGNGIVIGADDITLDLNGHTIDGDPTQGGGDGVRNVGFDGVTIENGTVRDFDGDAVRLSDAADNHVRGLSVPLVLADGVRVSGSSAGTLIEDDRVDAIGIAIAVDSNVRVERNSTSGDGLSASGKIGSLVVVGDDNRVEGNRASVRVDEGVGAGVPRGALVVVGGARNQILGNTTSDSPLDGIVVDQRASQTLLRGNLAERDGNEFLFGNGITVDSPSTSLASNSANADHDLGIRAVSGVTDLGGNRAEK